jgi:hypothetical protein
MPRANAFNKTFNILRYLFKQYDRARKLGVPDLQNWYANGHAFMKPFCSAVAQARWPKESERFKI